jgi:hypothetical protein
MRFVCLLLLLLTQIGCAQYMAVTQKGPLDRTALVPGGDRMQIMNTLGVPKVSNQEAADRLVDTYNYADGGKRNLPGWRISRALLYTAGDIFFLFLTQVIWMPAELLLSDTDYMTVVEYEPSDGNNWKAARITETKLSANSDIKNEVTVQERPGYSEERAAVLAAKQAADAAAMAAAAGVAAPAPTPTPSGGTCFAVAPDGLLLTANHVIGTADRIAVVFADGRSFDAQVERRNTSADAALLRVPTSTPTYVALGFGTGHTLGQSVFTFGPGAPAPEPAQLAEGAIDALTGPDGDPSYVRAAILPASSDAGAPLVDERGDVIGLVNEPAFAAVQPASAEATPPAGLWAIRSSKLSSLFPDEAPTLPPAASRDEAIARARGAMCRVGPAATQEASLEAAAP